MSERIGILAGTFDPIHKGHISFALQAIEEAGLDKVAFVPEPKPRYKQDATHVSHRIVMISLATKVYPKLEVLELPDKQFTVASSLPRLKQKFPKAQLLLLIGTDVLSHISVWPHVRTMLKETGVVVSVHGQKDERQALQLLANLPVEPPETHVIISNYKTAASRSIRADLKAGRPAKDVLAVVQKYASQHWLYESVAGSAGSAKRS